MRLPAQHVVRPIHADDMGKRYSFFYLIGCVASAFAGILAYGLMQMGGLQGITSWRWIFIIEGVLTGTIGIIGYIFLVGFPDDKTKYWGFLNDREKQWVINRVNADRGDANVEAFSMKKFLGAGLDIKVWGYALIFFDSTTLAYALAYFLPIILKDGMGFGVAEAQCLGAPPYVFAGIIMFATAWVGDRYHIRGPIILFNMVLCLIGLPIMGWASAPAVRYFGVFLVTAGANANVPAVMTYQANNIRGQWKRAFCSATLVGMGGVGGIAGSLIFRTQDAPLYRPGMYACIACCGLSVIITVLLMLRFKTLNAKADRGELTLEGSEDGFRYTY
ncbi:MFS general substrate transporter [Eremomyces bilateralis CBS 781.70]|uniref:MFS general substrate transporter n=1 Tax=Eremomyces bilateralis CBS 781.70 TaxID=1392243 RepID=A0A6G1G0D9_9PEZI|nr:MFS general substrate transporter [Eremomyces bilateralis CBS 781.70]KAF1811279.1 MFS general substrate transporter [Eremomyces bilateralis CBS 781.70]